MIKKLNVALRGAKEKMPVIPAYLETLNTPVNIFDFRREGMVYANKSFRQYSGLSEAECMTLTLPQYHTYIHDCDLKLLMHDVRGRMEELYPKWVQDDSCQLVFDVNFRMKNKGGEYRHILVKCTVIEWTENLFPAAILNLHTDITDHKKDIKMTLAVNIFNDDEQRWQEIHKEDFLRLPECLSKRETEIMRLMVKGKSLEMISKMLHISYNTVRKHCQNILNETDCESQEELKWMAVKEGWV